MRVKKQKAHRKIVRFYSACFGFREPYKVLLDGTFLHHLLLHRLSAADHSLSRLLAGRSLLFTTKCIVAELRNLGPSHSETLDAAKRLITARCDHEKRVSGTNCIQSVIRENNSEHFFVATQDPDLRKKFREVPGVPIIYGVKNSLFLEEPSLNQREFVKSAEEKRLHASESEFQKLNNKESEETLVIEGDSNSDQDKERKISVAEKPKFKIKRAKGPNPLSCKKRKPKSEAPSVQNQDIKEGETVKRKRIRKRKRHHTDKNKNVETTS